MTIHDDITTGVTTWRMRGWDDIQAKNGPTWTTTEVGLRPVESGLGGHEEGVIRVDAGVKNSSLLLWKWGRTAGSEGATLRCFTGVENDGISGNCEDKNVFSQTRYVL